MFGSNLSKELSRAYRNSSRGKALGVHMFGIKNAEQLDSFGSNDLKDLLSEAEVGVSYLVELCKARNIGRELKALGINLSRVK